MVLVSTTYHWECMVPTRSSPCAFVFKFKVHVQGFQIGNQWASVGTCLLLSMSLFSPDLHAPQFRKRTMLITNAPWMSNLPCPGMTPEKRPSCGEMWGTNPVSSILSFNMACSPVRNKLYQLQKLKSIEMVRKYRDSQGRAKVAPDLEYLRYFVCSPVQM